MPTFIESTWGNFWGGLCLATGNILPENQTISIGQLNFILLLMGLALLGGALGGRLFQKLRIPQVVGYIVIGIILGPTVLSFITPELLNTLGPFNYFALGLIGFMIGGELKKEVFVKYGKQLLYILLAESIGAFIVVTLLVGLIGSYLLRDTSAIWATPTAIWALALLLGSISSATAPAATTDVLWEYKTRGPLTRTVLAIVALDDGIALLLFAVATSVAGMLTSDAKPDIVASLTHPLIEIFGSLLVGFVAGCLLTVVIRRYKEEERVLTFAIGAVLLVLGVSLQLELDALLAAMALGATATNFAPRRSQEAFQLVQKFTPPTYVLFFVLVGAKLNVHALTIPVAGLVLLYLFGRSSGKMIGATLGARLGKAPASVRKYLPFCLFSQAGVAIGLAILVGHNAFLPAEIGATVVAVVVTTTFVVQLIGPPFVKYAVHKSGEIGLDITAEDILAKSSVKDFMDSEVARITEEMHLPEILQIFGETTNHCYPVVSDEGKLLGIITIDDIRDTILESELAPFLLAHDLMEPVPLTVRGDLPMREAQDLLAKRDLSVLPVVDEEAMFQGLLVGHEIQSLVSRRIMQIQKTQQDLD